MSLDRREFMKSMGLVTTGALILPDMTTSLLMVPTTTLTPSTAVTYMPTSGVRFALLHKPPWEMNLATYTEVMKRVEDDVRSEARKWRHLACHAPDKPITMWLSQFNHAKVPEAFVGIADNYPQGKQWHAIAWNAQWVRGDTNKYDDFHRVALEWKSTYARSGTDIRNLHDRLEVLKP